MNLLMVLGRTDEAIREMRIAKKSDPLSPEVQYFLAYGLTLKGRYDEAASHCEKLPADYPSEPECRGRALLGQGKVPEALQVLARLCCRGNRGYLGYAFARAGRREEAQNIACQARAQPFNEALAYAGLGDKEPTLEVMDRMAILGPARVGRDLAFPEFAFGRDDPRVKAVLRRVGLPN